MNELVRTVYAGLLGLKKSLDPKDFYIAETYVAEYHKILQDLKGAGIDIEKFEIPSIAVAPRISWKDSLTGEVGYMTERQVERTLFMSKLEKALIYIELGFKERYQEPERKIGFQQSTN